MKRVGLKKRSKLAGLLMLVTYLVSSSTALGVQTNEALFKQYLNQGYTYLRDSNYVQAIASFKHAIEIDPSSARARLDLAYTLLSTAQDKEAVAAFEEAVRLDPHNVQVRSQLGYLYLHLDQTRDALRQFLEVEKLDPTNYQVKNQLGFIYDKLGDKEQARELFSEALASTDDEINSKARQALKNLAPAGAGRAGAFVNEVYAAPFYQSRFGNGIAPLIFRSGVILEPTHGLEAYGSVRFTRDTRSVGGSAPQIYSDNFVVTGIGVRVHPFKNYWTVYAEAGIATNLLRSPVSTVHSRSDFRAGIDYAREWGTQTETRNEVSGPTAPMKFVADAYLNASYYSRFRNNVIAYAQYRPGVRFFKWNKTSLDAFAKVAAVKDKGGDFYNNLAEGGGGLRFTPYRPFGVSISAEYVRGIYFGIARPGEPNPYAPQYNDFRIMITLNKYLTRE